MDKVSSYFNGDTMAADVWKGKYQMKTKSGEPLEETPACMHRRLAEEFGRVESVYVELEKDAVENGLLTNLSPFGQQLINKRLHQSKEEITDEVFSYFNRFKYIVPQGSIMSNLGNSNVFGSLSNCFVIKAPSDSYGGIMRADQELVQLMKRRGGVGTHLSNLRPEFATVTNAARSSTGVPSFAERYSNSTREVGQDGRRGALMLLLAVQHPDIFKFVTMKEDRTKVTGANISVMFTDDFMFQVENNAEDFICTFPIDLIVHESEYRQLVEFNKLYCIDGNYFMKIKPKELFDTFVNMAWSNAEPGAAYIDRIQDYSPDGVYDRYRPTKCNPCGEIWMADYDACRLIAMVFLSCVNNPFSEKAKMDLDKLYEVAYMQQRLGDALIDLEVEYIQRIIDKIASDPLGPDESFEERWVEIDLWQRVQSTTRDGRRTGSGFTALGDTLAALNLKYDSEEGLAVIKQMMATKMRAELDSTIDMAILRGTFKDWDGNLEFTEKSPGILRGENAFFQMLCEDFPEQAIRMFKFGRRNVSWSTVAPTGTVSLMTQTTSGLEPLFKAYYIRRKKINPNDADTRVDFIDQNGDKWQEYPILHPQFKEWINVAHPHYVEGDIPEMSKDTIQDIFEESPWYGSEADDIAWEKRIDIQSIIQHYTSNAISSTINLPTDVSKEVVSGIYMEAWRKGLKGVTIYRDGSRTGVLVSEPKKLTTVDTFGYNDAVKRPTELEADFHYLTSRGKKYGVFVGKLDGNPYEIFVSEDPMLDHNTTGKLIKVRKGAYKFVSNHYTSENLQLSGEHAEEKMLTRWVSLLLRHGANPKFIIDQVDKSEVPVLSFSKVIIRVLKKYIPEEVTGEACNECGQQTMIYEEGCKKCKNCGYSKC